MIFRTRNSGVKSNVRRGLVGLVGLSLAISSVSAEDTSRKVPDVLQTWQDWVLWGDRQRDCPRPSNGEQTPLSVWPSRLHLTTEANKGTWHLSVTVFEESWVSLPGSAELWPRHVQVDGKPATVVERAGIPSVQLPAGQYRISGELPWPELPQRIALPPSIGMLALEVNGKAVNIPDWDPEGFVWLKRSRAEATDKDFMSVQIYRVVEDGIPIWLRTEIEVTVSGKSREEELGWILPQGWKLSMVESPLPVAVDEAGRVKAQVRAGKWTIAVHAFRVDSDPVVQFAPDVRPIATEELVGFRAAPELRVAELEGMTAVDVAQTTFPEKWRQLPVYRWDAQTPFRVAEKMRGMGDRRPEGLQIERTLWLDGDGQGLTFHDQIRGQMQQIWRLNVAEGQTLGAVRMANEGQLITADRQSGAHGVEIRTRNVQLDAMGRIANRHILPATGWQASADALTMTLSLPPGWRLFALFGADRVDGDWLTAWSLLDLFVLLIFTVAVFRLWGLLPAVVAFLAMGLSYHEPNAPRFTWLLLLMPIALLRVVPEGTARKWVTAWKYVSMGILLLVLVPFVARQVQGALFPQLERPGLMYGATSVTTDDLFGDSVPADYPNDAMVPNVQQSQSVDQPNVPSSGPQFDMGFSRGKESKLQLDAFNLKYDPKAVIQTGPAQPEWTWNQIHCRWNGPVGQDQQVRMWLISLGMHRFLTVVRLVLLIALAGIVFRVSRWNWRLWKGPARSIAVGCVGIVCAMSGPSVARAEFPSPELLETLRERLLEPSDAFPNAADIASASIQLKDGRITMTCEIHTAATAAVPLPGQLPAWSPVSVKVEGQDPAVVCRNQGYLWIALRPGVHQVVLEGLLPNTTEWEWNYLLKPRYVAVDAPGWSVTGVRPTGMPEQQVIFTRTEVPSASEAAYDQKNFDAVIAIDRHLEIGLVWKVSTVARRLSAPGKSISLKIPLLPQENVLTSNAQVADGMMEVRLGPDHQEMFWESELPVGNDIHLDAPKTDQWVERWHLVTSPVWNVALSRLAPVYSSQGQDLIPTWQPWPGEGVTLSFAKPEAVAGDTITLQRVHHQANLGDRERISQLKLDVDCSLARDLELDLGADAEVSSLNRDGQMMPVRRNGPKLIVPLQPGKQSIDIAWRTAASMKTQVTSGSVTLPVASSNVTTVVRMPEDRWILWAKGPQQGPAVRYWTIVICAVIASLVLGATSLSPLRRYEWVLLTLGLTQVHLVAGLFVVAWLFALALRGTMTPKSVKGWSFNLLQLGLIFMTFVSLVVLVDVVGKGLLGDPEMFIAGNDSSSHHLQWYQPRVESMLPEPQVFSISVWYFRLLMLAWALWLATALLRWLKWGWDQFSTRGTWRRWSPMNQARGAAPSRSPSIGASTAGPDAPAKDRSDD